ncbi:MAG: hypothetical protein ACKOWF_00260 [Chloroflexota bacterium]
MDGRRFDALARALAPKPTRRTLLRWAAAIAAARAAGRHEAAAQGLCTLDGGFCPAGCFGGSACLGCCGGQCSASGVCGRAACMSSGCACTGGLSWQCGFGLTCCVPGGIAYGSGTCQPSCPWSG